VSVSVVPAPAEVGPGRDAATIDVRVAFSVLTLLSWYSPLRLRIRWLHATDMRQIGRLRNIHFICGIRCGDERCTTHFEFVTGYQSWKIVSIESVCIGREGMIPRSPNLPVAQQQTYTTPGDNKQHRYASESSTQFVLNTFRKTY
jgi:hypothetical protein